MHRRLVKAFIIIGVGLIIFAVAGLTIFQVGYLGELGSYSEPTKTADEQRPTHFTMNQEFLFIAKGEDGCEVLNISDPSHPSRLYTFYSEYPFTDVEVQNSTLYAITRNGRITLYNCSQLNQTTYPSEIGHLSFLIYNPFQQIHVAGNNSFILTENGNVYVINCEDPDDIKEENKYVGEGKYRGMFYENDLLYLTGEHAELEIYNITLPNREEDVPLYISPAGNGHSITKNGNFTYITNEEGVAIFDVHNASAPEKLLQLNMTTGVCDLISIVPVRAGLIMHNKEVNHLLWYNISTPAEPLWVMNFTQSQDEILDILIRNSTLFFLTKGDPGLNIYNMTETGDIILRTFYYTGNAATKDLAVQFPLLFLADGKEGVKVLNYSHASQPELIASFHDGGDVYLIESSGPFLYTADISDGFEILNISRLDSIEKIGVYSIEEHQITDFVIFGSYAIIARGYGGIQILDLTNPSNPIQIGGYTTEGRILAIDFRFPYLYAAYDDLGVLILNLSSMTSVQFVSKISDEHIISGVNDVSVEDEYLYIAGEFDGFDIYEISNPANPRPFYFLPENLKDSSTSISVVNKTAFITKAWSGVYCYNVTNPSAPQRLGHYTTNSYSHTIVVSGHYAFLANDRKGVFILDTEYTNSPSLLGGVLISLFFGFGFTFSTVGIINTYRNREDPRKILSLVQHHKFGLSEIPRDELKETLSIIRLHPDLFQFTAEGIRLVQACLEHLDVSSTPSNSTELEAALDKLYAYYEKPAIELAYALMHSVNLTLEEIERLGHEGSYKERQILERFLPDDHPLLIKITKKLEIPVSSEFVMLK